MQARFVIVNGIDETQQPLKVAAVARRTGVSVRTLHYYEEIGLLSPTGRTPAGHRLYTRSNVERLQQIRSMQQLGMSLSQIHDCLREGKLDARRVLSDHLTRVREEREALGRLERQLVTLSTHFEDAAHDDLESIEIFLNTVEVITMFDKYFSEAQLARLKQQHETVGQVVTPTIEALQRALDAKVAPDSEQALTLMQRFGEALDEVTGGDRSMLEAIQRMLHTEEAARRDHGISEELYVYMRKIAGDSERG